MDSGFPSGFVPTPIGPTYCESRRFVSGITPFTSTIQLRRARSERAPSLPLQRSLPRDALGDFLLVHAQPSKLARVHDRVRLDEGGALPVRRPRTRSLDEGVPLVVGNDAVASEAGPEDRTRRVFYGWLENLVRAV